MTVLKHNNYSVDAVYDGAILDIMMPKMDSLTVLKTILLHGNPFPVLLIYQHRNESDWIVSGFYTCMYFFKQGC